MNIVKERDDGIILRFAESEDKDKIYEFALAAIAGTDLPEFAQDAGENLQERIETGDPEHVLIAEDTNRADVVVGYIELDPNRSQEQGVMYIRGIFVLPEYRRKGIGHDLLEIIREKENTEGIQLRVNAFTIAGLKFWEEFGFKIHHYSLFHDASP